MTMHDHSGHQDEGSRSILNSRAGLVLLGFIIIAGALLFTEHRAHVLGALIYLPLLLSVKLSVERPGAARPVTFQFKYDHR
jgi:hypothetical protein